MTADCVISHMLMPCVQMLQTLVFGSVQGVTGGDGFAFAQSG